MVDPLKLMLPNKDKVETVDKEVEEVEIEVEEVVEVEEVDPTLVKMTELPKTELLFNSKEKDKLYDEINIAQYI